MGENTLDWELDYFGSLDWHDKSFFVDDQKPISREELFKKRIVRKGKKISKSSEVDELAQELIILKKKIKNLQMKERIIKEKLAHHIPVNGWMEVISKDNEFIIERLKYKHKPRFNQSKFFGYVRRKFGASAVNFMMDQCFDKCKFSDAIYVRPFSKSDRDELDLNSNDLNEKSNHQLHLNDDDIPF